MKRNFTILLLLFLIIAAILPAKANQVSLVDAEIMAKHVFKKALQADNKSLKTDAVSISSIFTEKDGATPLYTIYNFAPKGFVILSAEDNYNALLAFSTENAINFETKNENPVYTDILKSHEIRIKYVRENNIKATPEIEKEWANLRLAIHSTAKKSVNLEIVVSPLTTTKWGQGTFYNQFLPTDTASAQDDHVWGGCIPLAMSQLIKFHNWPPQGNGSNTYTDDSYGVQSAEFCGTDYNWDNMPDQLTDYNEDVATLVSQMGIATNTDYSPSYTSTYVSYVRNAFVSYFNFDESAAYFFDAYNDFPWVARQELDAGRPLIITGNNSTGQVNHCWVVDGYGYLTDATVTQAEYFHMNWGWNGEYNGWYLDNGTNWKPAEGQDLDATIRYIFDRYVIYKLFPAADECAPPTTAYVSSINDTYTYLYYQNRLLEEDIQFRYKEVGSTQWTELEPSSNYYKYLGDLSANTLYEFEAKRNCCGGVWSNYGPANTFRTAPAGQTCKYFTKSTATDYAQIAGYNLETHNLYRIDYNQNGYVYIYGFKESCNSDATTSYFDCYGESVPISTIGNASYSTLNLNDCTIPVDCANNTGTFFFTQCDSGESYYFIEAEDGIIYDPYFPDSLDIVFAEGTTVNFDFVQAAFGSPCSIATGGAIWFTCIEYNTDNVPSDSSGSEIFQTYPFLKDLVDPTNCTTEKIEVYDKGNYAYINISYANGTVDFYLNTGTYYCGNRPNRVCTELYNLTDSDITTTWSCGGTTTNPEPEPEPEPDPTCSNEIGDLSTSYRTTTSVYLYTPQPLGVIPNQFRYRPVGSTEWALTDISDKYYKKATDITAGVEYEFQVRNECSTDSWSEYTASYYFNINGATANSKQILPALSKLELNNRTHEGVMKIYPNPASNNILITGFSTTENEVELTIIDLIGNVVLNKLYNSQNDAIRLTVEDLATGIYIAEIKQGSQYLIKKFIKE